MLERTDSTSVPPPTPKPPAPPPASPHFQAAVAAAKTTTPYTVRPDDTLTGIAATHKVSTQALSAANPGITNPDLIHAGEVLAVPDLARPAPPVARPAPPPPPLAKPGIAAQTQSILAAAQKQSTPEAALRSLSTGYDHAPKDVQQAVMADPETSRIVGNAANWATQPLKYYTGFLKEQGPDPDLGEAAIDRLDTLAKSSNQQFAAAVTDRAMTQLQPFLHDEGNNFVSSQGMASLMDLSGRIAGTPQGNDAINKFAASTVWSQDGMGDNGMADAIGKGGSLAYPMALARAFQSRGQQPTMVSRAIEDGMQQFQQKIGGDVHALASHDAELSWVLKNQGAGMTPSQIAAGVAGYIKSKGADWQKQQTQLLSQISQDGTQLLSQMRALNQSASIDGLGTKDTNAALKALVTDPSANLAISTALKSNPDLVSDDQASALHSLFTGAELGEAGKSLTEQLATAYVRQNLLGKLQGLNLTGKNSMLGVQQAKADIEGLAKGPMAKLLGVSQGQMDDAVDALKTAVLDTGKHIGDPQAEQDALAALNKKFQTDPDLSEAFNENTFAGQLMRGVGVAFAGVGLYNSAGKAISDPSVQNDASALLSAAGFVQQSADALTSIGAISEESTLGKFGGAFKIAGDAGAGDLIDGVGAVLNGISAVRAGFGLGQEQDVPEGIFDGMGAIGGGMMVAGAVGEFAGASLLGPIGAGVAAVGIVGEAIYDWFKDQHQYEDAGRAFLSGAGYDAQASDALSRQVDDGRAMMPYLAKYASLTGMSPSQQMSWVNSLSGKQVDDLAQQLGQAVSDSNGSVKDFTNGAPQATKPVYGRFIETPSRELENTVTALNQFLRNAGVPLPQPGS